MKIYYGIDRKCCIPYVDHAMISFRTMMKRKTPIIDNGTDWFMDSGAFTFLKQYGEYPIKIGTYLKTVNYFNPNRWAIQDWCCEPSVLRSTGLNVLQHIGNTVESGRQLIDFNDKCVMVIQGWTKRDYLTCIDYIHDYNLFTEMMGIGTICGRTDVREVFDILKSIKAEIPDYCKVHCFGLSLNLLKYKEIYDQVFSVDTNAYDFWRLDSTNETIINNLIQYKKKVDNVMNKNKKQSILTDIN